MRHTEIRRTFDVPKPEPIKDFPFEEIPEREKEREKTPEKV